MNVDENSEKTIERLKEINEAQVNHIRDLERDTEKHEALMQVCKTFMQDLLEALK